MRRFQFRLATVVRLREAVRDERRAQLADALAVQATLEEKLEGLQRDLDEARRLQTAPVGPVNVDRLLTGERYEVQLLAEQQTLKVQLSKVLTEVARRRAALVAADQDVRALEKLRASQHEAWRLDSDRELMRELDEAAGRSVPADKVL